MPTITAWPTQKPPTRSASRDGSPGTEASTSTPAGLLHPPQAHSGTRHSAAGHLAVDAIAVASFWVPVDGAAGRRRGYSGAQRRPAGTSLAARMGRSRLGQSHTGRPDGVADLGSLGRVQGLVLLEMGKLEQALGAADDPVDQPGAGRLGTGVGGEQLQVLLVVDAPLLDSGCVERPGSRPVGVGGTDLLIVLVPLGPVAAGDLGQSPAAGLVPDLGGGGVGGQLQAGLLPIVLVLEVVAASQLGQGPVSAGAVAAAVLPLAAAGLALGGAPVTAATVDVEQLHPLGLTAVAAHLGKHHQHLEDGNSPTPRCPRPRAAGSHRRNRPAPRPARA